MFNYFRRKRQNRLFDENARRALIEELEALDQPQASAKSKATITTEIKWRSPLATFIRIVKFIMIVVVIAALYIAYLMIFKPEVIAPYLSYLGL